MVPDNHMPRGCSVDTWDCSSLGLEVERVWAGLYALAFLGSCGHQATHGHPASSSLRADKAPCGSPGHSSSTSMSPLTALSTGKPMDSHPNYTDTPVSAPRTLSAVGTPLNALGSPYRVIASAMGPPSGALAAPAGINLVAPPSSQLNVVNSVSISEDIKPLPGLPGIGNMNYPSTSPGSLVKHICAICGDRSSAEETSMDRGGEFSKVPELSWARGNICLSSRVPAVQEERQRSRERAESEAECASSGHEDMPVERILEAELAVEPKTESYGDMNMENSTNDPVTNICHAADKQLFTLVEWAKRIPHFSDLTLEDQVILLRDLHPSAIAYMSTAAASTASWVGFIFDRVLTELVSKMKDMQMDKAELGCLRAIVLFNPDAKGLSNPSEVETLREKVYATLEAYTKQKYPEQPGRFAKLLLRLPALRSIGLKCLEHLFFFKLIGDTPIDTFLMEMLETPLQIT
ncbi:retinoic acid receptor RXR-gamma [Puma concolor]|uniref:Retinoic acid receptor RXR n=1 Tax=Puma concolor TaxID=9696 RepID=A0A6P6I900_PUMCO|nr:retinoic acid receptor RXR-gamma [Puma concolor]